MQTFETHTIREIALTSPAATRVFEEFQIDYSSLGSALFGDACKTAGVNPKVIESKLTEVVIENKGAEFDRISRSSLAEITKYILEKHHIYTKREIQQLLFLADQVVRHYGERQFGLFRVREILTEIFEEVVPHMTKEEIVLFPYIVELEARVAKGIEWRKPHFGSLANPLRGISAEHARIGVLFTRLRSAADECRIPDSGFTGIGKFFVRLKELEADFREHIRLEDDVLFPRSILLDEEAKSLSNRVN